MTTNTPPKVKVVDKCPHCGLVIDGYMQIPNSGIIELQLITKITLPKEKH